MTSILILNGPNLNLLGTRQPEIYGRTTLDEVEALCRETAASLGVDIEFLHSNHEGVLIDAVHGARGRHDGLIINAGGLTHTSISLMDAITGVQIPAIELHISNTHAREDFRKHSYISKAAYGIICGFGPFGYTLALRALAERLKQPSEAPA